MTANYVKMIPLQTFNTANLTGNYQILNPGGLPEACYLVKFFNNSTEPVYISMDGTTDGDYLPPEYTFPIYAQCNAQKRDTGFWAKGTTFWIKGTASVGLFLISGYYEPHI